ncbi:hypothetical protein K466DRAFT_591396 [Polyporus arcularius HHB13444]|uniref:IPT/TIG domain-containing protein n=1 Tax=Polyporus arcularius HHB13444 TaxID=1314778 RepID=A0A5C3NWP8_9APHY|nr:hypothetical protein K466DRAFT_591396 [Polyporus arcularius HHB13444]
MMSQEELSAWCKSLPNAEFLINGDIQYGEHVRKLEERPSLNLEDLLQEHVYEDVTPAAHNIPSESMFCPVTSPSSPTVSTTAGIASSRPFIVSTKPVPPPAQVRKDPPALQRVVFPEKETCSNLPIMFPSLPEGGTKSRVETQIRLTVDLAHASSSSGEPHKYDKVGSWKWLRLPKGTTTKKRTRKEGKVDAPAEESLYLTAEITCATPPHTRVSVCSSCQTREAKRVARKIAARVRPARSDSESQEEPRVIPGKGRHEDTSNILQFNCPEVLDFSSGSVILPLRITCYCRHHREKVGFHLHFTMHDHTGRIVGTGSTKPIMITDDHKSTGVNAQRGNSEFGAKLDWTVAGTDSQESAPKRKKTLNGTERAKKRAKPYDAGSRVSRLHRQSSSGSLHSPSEMTSALVTRASSPLQQNAISQPPLHIVTTAASPAPSSYSYTDHPSSSVAAHPSDVLESGTSTAVASPSLAAFDSNVSIADFINSNFNVDVAMPDCSDMGSPAVSYHDPSHSPFLAPHQPPIPIPPPMAEPMDLAMPMPVPPVVPLPYMLFKHDPPPPITLPQPRIHRLIPACGPTYGGIEVTVLGANFHPSMQLNCMFGGVASTSTQRWSDNTLVCILPPSVAPGQVHVWFEGLPKEEDGSPPCLFTYTDETDRALMELALQVVGLKMTGKIEDARNIAMRIVGNTGGPEADGSMHAGGAMQLSSHLLLGRAGDNREFEKTLIDFLTVLDVPTDSSSVPTESSFISKPTTSGQTLLHLATLAKFPALVKFLIARDIDIDARDQNGCTALFLAALTDSAECARALVDADAALDVVNAAGRTPAEVGPAGFFDFMADTDRSSEDGGHDEDEAAWGDGEEESDSEIDARPVRRGGRKRAASHRATKQRSIPAPTFATSEAHPVTDVNHTPSPSTVAAEKKAVEAGLAAADEKQAATFTETLYRTLAQLQHPQGMIANIPILPLLHIPNLPGIPAWGTIAQIPVFPVLVPIQQFWGDRRGRGADGTPEGAGAEQNGQQAWMSVLSPQDWKAFLEKWMQQAMATKDPDVHDTPPPAYSPRTADESFIPDAKKAEPAAEVASTTTTEQPAPCEAEAEPEQQLGAERAVVRQVGYKDAAVPAEEAESYGYRPTRKPARRAQKKQHDRMLVLFWIPILIIGFAWAFLHALRIALHTAKALVTLKVGLTAA